MIIFYFKIQRVFFMFAGYNFLCVLFFSTRSNNIINIFILILTLFHVWGFVAAASVKSLKYSVKNDETSPRV